MCLKEMYGRFAVEPLTGPVRPWVADLYQQVLDFEVFQEIGEIVIFGLPVCGNSLPLLVNIHGWVFLSGSNDEMMWWIGFFSETWWCFLITATLAVGLTFLLWVIISIEGGSKR